MKRLEMLLLPNGIEPFREWLGRLDEIAQAKILAFLERVAMGGSKKNIKALGYGIFEVKIDHGPGYRAYFGEVGQTVILLLLGGDKGSQSRDIRQAKEYWWRYVQK